MRPRGRRVIKGFGFAGIFLAGLAVLSLVVMLLWNWLLPALFGAPRLHYLQAAGVLLLSQILFGSRGHRGRWRHHMWHQRWESLTPEERERLREKYAHKSAHHHCHWHGTEQGSENQQV